MRSGKWRVCATVIALGVATNAPVHAGPVAKKAPVVVKETELEEAARLTKDVERLSKEGKYDEALALAERVLAIRQKALGPDHPDVAILLHNFALVCQMKGDYTRAESLLQRSLAIKEKVTLRLLPLGGTAEEAKTIHTLFPDSRVLMGVDATEEAIKAVHAPRLLHLATHGFFLPERPVPEVLLHATGSEPTAAERAAILQRENPLLRSGIALAGFNQRKSGIDDGVLTALEVAGLDLYGTRLVVLSACETGVGHASSGEGVYGLRRALSMAGAETQVSGYRTNPRADAIVLRPAERQRRAQRIDA